MKGFFGGLLNVIGWGTLLFVLASGFATAAGQQGGVKSLINQTVTDPGQREDILNLQLSSVFLTPLVEVNIFGRDIAFSVDAFTILIVLSLSMLVAYLSAVFFHPSMFYLILIFIIAFIAVGTLWEGFWLDKYLDAGQNLGIGRDTLMANLRGTGVFFENPILLVINVIAFAFVFYRLWWILPGV